MIFIFLLKGRLLGKMRINLLTETLFSQYRSYLLMVEVALSQARLSQS